MCPYSLVGHLETAIVKNHKIWRFSADFLCLVILPKLAENKQEMCRDEKSFVIHVYLLFVVQIMPN